MFSNIASFRDWLVDSTYFAKILTEFRAMIFSLNYAYFASRFVLFVVFCMTRKIMKICVMCEIYCDYRFLNAFFMFYFPIDRHEIHVKLVHINSRWIETITYRVTLNEMFVCNSLIYIRMSKFWRNVLTKTVIFRSFWFVCMLKYDEMCYNDSWTACGE